MTRFTRRHESECFLLLVRVPIELIEWLPLDDTLEQHPNVLGTHCTIAFEPRLYSIMIVAGE